MSQRYATHHSTNTHDSNSRHHPRYSINNLRDRSALTSSSNPNGNYSSPYLGQSYSNRTADELEAQNDEEIDGLSAKVKMLKDVRLLIMYLVEEPFNSLFPQISLGIGNEIRESTTLAEAMVSCKYCIIRSQSNIVSERCIRRNFWYTQGYFSTHEQHVSTPGLPVALVYYFPNNCVLVFPCRVVVSEIMHSFCNTCIASSSDSERNQLEKYKRP
jgi:hypothetical protein